MIDKKKRVKKIRVKRKVGGRRLQNEFLLFYNKLKQVSVNNMKELLNKSFD